MVEVTIRNRSVMVWVTKGFWARYNTVTKMNEVNESLHYYWQENNVCVCVCARLWVCERGKECFWRMCLDGWFKPLKPSSSTSPALLSWPNIEVRPPLMAAFQCKGTTQKVNGMPTGRNTIAIFSFSQWFVNGGKEIEHGTYYEHFYCSLFSLKTKAPLFLCSTI